MSSFPGWLYCLMLKMHPASFREDFGREMAMDFDALRSQGLAGLYGDCVRSLARQWLAWALSAREEAMPAAAPSLLNGQYATVLCGGLTPLAFARGMVVSVLLLSVFALAKGAALPAALPLPLGSGAATPNEPGRGKVVLNETAPQPGKGGASRAAAVSAANVAPQPARHGGMLHATGVRPSFEVASIRPSAPHAELRFSGIGMPPSGLFTATGVSIKELVEFAFAVPSENELSGGPGWMRTEKFDVTAKPGEMEVAALRRLSSDEEHVQMRLMVQSLLEERAHLKVSFSTKEMPLYGLSVAKGGLRCAKAAPNGEAGPPPPPPPPPPGQVPPPGEGREQMMHWSARGMPFPFVVEWITQQPELGGRMVVDRTGLQGVFDCEVTWAREGADVSGPGLFKAVEEQMGLKLQGERGPVETLVIDGVERPSGN